MRRHLMIIGLTLLASLAPIRAHAAECGPNTKIVKIKPHAFVPDLQYLCGGQSVVLYNETGNSVSFKYRDAYNQEKTITNLRHGSGIQLYAATTVYSVVTYGRSGYGIPNGRMLWGMAPDSY
ncbi:hypothetical protein ACOI1H_03180 [Loktanella sp. DJP18]|uniref:hypothetical protein n=1 Tax=Loktanella sp. DJP18 TaxID=3409788 RepID=UPI003BB68C6B